jgi:hypothetical protein
VAFAGAAYEQALLLIHHPPQNMIENMTFSCFPACILRITRYSAAIRAHTLNIIRHGIWCASALFRQGANTIRHYDPSDSPDSLFVPRKIFADHALAVVPETIKPTDQRQDFKPSH